MFKRTKDEKIEVVVDEVGSELRRQDPCSATSSEEQETLNKPEQAVNQILDARLASDGQEPAAALVQQTAKHSSPAISEASVQPRNWLGAIVVFILTNSYFLIMTQFSQLIVGGGPKALLSLIELNFVELAGFFAFGTGLLVAQTFNSGAFHPFFLALMAYWSLFVIYPTIIFLGTSDGRVFSRTKETKSKCLEVLMVLVGLAIFLPLPCVRFWRNGGPLNFMLSSRNKAFKEKIEQVDIRLTALPMLQSFPEYLARISEYLFNFTMGWYFTLLFLLHLTQRLPYQEVFGSLFWEFVLAQLAAAALCPFAARLAQRMRDGGKNEQR